VPIPHQEQSANAIRVLVRCDTEPKVRVSELATRSSPRESSSAAPPSSLDARLPAPRSPAEQSVHSFYYLNACTIYFLNSTQEAIACALH
jgi:hypothetical protein